MEDKKNIEAPNSINATDLKQQCKNYDQYFESANLLPAVLIILLLSIVQHRKKIFAFERTFPYLIGRFGVVVPVDFTCTLKNRWSYAFAFGAVAQHMVSLIMGISNPFPFTVPAYLQVFVYMVAAVKVAVACMPFFACLSTPHQLLGGVLGLLYSVFWFSMQMWDIVWCSVSKPDKHDLIEYFLYYELFLDLPNLLCMGFLVCRFGFQVVKDILIRLKKIKRREEETKAQYRYVQRLLQRPMPVQKSWFQKNVYEWDPYFKFPNRIIVTVVLSFLTLYMMMFTEEVMSSLGIILLYGLCENFKKTIRNELIKHLSYAEYTWYFSSACAALSCLIHISHVLVYYRKHIKSMWAGEKKYLPRNYTPSPTVSVGGLLKYSGYQIAFTLWGYLLVHLAMFIGGMVVVYTVILPIQTDGFLNWLTDVMTVLANFFVLLAVMGLQRVFIHVFFLQDKISPTDKDKPLALNNRRVFHNVNYFFFFFNVILGVMSCVMRLMKSTAMGLMLLPRIERAIMPQGFEKWDKSYCTWLGMIIADHHHNNPVLVCFCHLMLKHTQQFVQVDSDPAVKERVRTRWLLMYTLVRNPKLVLMRKQLKTNRKDAEYAFAWAISNTTYTPL